MIYNNLSTDEITQLEFQAGKKAAELIDGIKEDMKGKLDVNLSAADNGKILQVGADGKVTPMAPASGLTIDDTLTVEGAAADAKAAGDKIADLKSAIEMVIVHNDYSDSFTTNKFVYTNYSSGDTLDINNLVSNTSYAYKVIPVYAGRTYRFTATTESGTSKRAYVLTDSNYVVLLLGGNGTNYTDFELNPTVDGYLIINAKKASPYALTEYSYPVEKEVDELSNVVNSMNDTVTKLDGYFVASKNILNPANASDNKNVSSTGEITDSPNYMLSDYIEVKPSTKYTAKGVGFVSEWTEDKTFNRRLVSDNSSFTTRSTTKYIRYSAEKAYYNLSECRICEGNTVTDEPFFEIGLNYGISLTDQLDGINAELEEVRNDVESLIPSYGVPFIPSIPYKYDGNAIAPYKSSGHLADIYALYDALLEQYPQYIHKQVIGTDASGQYEIRAYSIDNGTNYAYRLPRIVWLASIHGNEGNTTISTYFMVKEILEKFATDPVCYGIMSAVRLYVIPAVNPWGVENYSRLNANNVNLNRNFPADWIYRDPNLAYGETKYGIESSSNGSNQYYYYGGGSVVYDDTTQTATTTYVAEPETRAIMDFINSINTGANLHGKVCFAVNKHDAGSMSQEGALFLFKDNFTADRPFIRNLTDWLKPQIMATQNWLTEKTGLNIGTVSYSMHDDASSAGTMDKWYNAIGIHGGLCEIPKDAGSSFTDTQHYSDLCAINVEFGLNLLSNVIINNAKLKDDTQTEQYIIVT